jgi:hypothetical protein
MSFDRTEEGEAAFDEVTPAQSSEREDDTSSGTSSGTSEGTSEGTSSGTSDDDGEPALS